MRSELAIGFVVGVVAAMVVLTVFGRDDNAVPDVHVATDGEQFRCTGTNLLPTASEPDDPQSNVAQSIELLPDLQCQIRFWVVNDGDSAVTVGKIVMPYLGEGTGGSLQATNLTPWRSESATWYGAKPPRDPLSGYEVIHERVDIVWPVQDRVEASDRLYYEVWVEFNPDGCTADGGRFDFEGPQVFLGGKKDAIAYFGPQISATGTSFSSCDS